MTRRGYARGRKAWGMDARTNERVLLRELVKDGRTGLPVTRQAFEPKDPQERAPGVFDPQVLRRPTSDLDRPAYRVNFPTGPWNALHETYRSLTAHYAMGRVAVENVIEGDVYEVGVYESGVYE